MADRATTHGKQVLLDGAHLCDARDPVAAECIAALVNHGTVTAARAGQAAVDSLRALLSEVAGA